jgi:protein-export membrane protein SecD/preprotein translocase SecF subunit
MKGTRFKLAFVILLVAGAIGLFYPPDKKIRKGLDLQGGVELAYRLNVEHLPEAQQVDAIDDAVGVIRLRIDRSGVLSPDVRAEGEQVLVQLPGADEETIRRVKETIQTQGTLEFRFVVSEGSDEWNRAARERERGNPPPKGVHWYSVGGSGERAAELLVEDAVCLSGEHLVRGSVQKHWDPEETGYDLVFSFQGNGIGQLADATSPKHIGRRLAIVMNDVRDAEGALVVDETGRPFGTLYSAPNITDRSHSTDGNTGIDGSFAEEEASRLVHVLRSGSLPGRLELLSEVTVGPLLGADSIRQGKRAVVIGFLLVFGFVVAYYRGGGLISATALLVNLALLLGALAALGATLTLPGIAGVILTIGMAVDTNVLIFERIREEKVQGRSLAAAVELAFHRALPAILDSNVTVLITGVILYGYGSGPVQGFATTLSLGILTSLFSGLFVTRVLLALCMDQGVLRTFSMGQFFRDTKFGFMRWAWGGTLFSAVVILVGISFVVRRGEGLLGIDFTGGAMAQVKLTETVSTEVFKQRVHRMFREKGYRDESPKVYAYLGTGGGMVPGRSNQFGIICQDRDAGVLDRLGVDLKKAFEGELAPEPFGGFALQPRAIEVRLVFKQGLSREELLSRLHEHGYPEDRVRVEPLRSDGDKIVEARVRSLQGDLERFQKELQTRIFPGDLSLDHFQREGETDPPAYRARFSKPVSPEALQKKLEELGYEGVGLPAGSGDLAQEVLFRVKSTDEVKLRKDLDEGFGLAPPFDEAREVPASTHGEVRLLPSPGEEGLKRLLGSIDSRIRLAGYSEAGGLGRAELEAPGYRPDPLKEALRKGLRGHLSEPIPKATFVSGAVADRTQQDAVMAILLSFLAVTLYITFRFEFLYGLAAVIALVHDVLVTLGFLAAFGFTIDLEIIGALLTVVGYSLNDTIVIFDRIRENARFQKGMSFSSLIDLSVNHTLNRTILTSGVTLLAILPLWVGGGVSVRGFAFALGVGMIAGTYSTVFIASAFLHLLKKENRKGSAA